LRTATAKQSWEKLLKVSNPCKAKYYFGFMA